MVMTATAVLFGSFAILLLISVPIGIALGLATLITIFYSGSMPLRIFSQRISYIC